jgi:putative ABC transport system substrate-binding protein
MREHRSHSPSLKPSQIPRMPPMVLKTIEDIERMSEPQSRGLRGPVQPRTARIGYLAPVFACSGSVPSLDAFRQGLQELGYVEKQNIVIECRSAGGSNDRLRQLAVELVQMKVDVIVAAGDEPVARAAHEATRTIPIVMTNVGDPVATGLVRSLARPGGNVTGLVTVAPELSAKRLELLHEAFPHVSRVAVFRNPANREHDAPMTELTAAAPALGVQLQTIDVRAPDDFDNAFASITTGRAQAILTLPDPLTVGPARRIAEFAAKSRLPGIYHRRESIEAGGLMAYGPSYNALFRRAAYFVDKILKGAKPADLPVEQPTRFDLVINLKTAKALGLTIPQSLLLRADEVIQ